MTDLTALTARAGHRRREPKHIDRLFVCCRDRKQYTDWCADQGVPEQGEHILWVTTTTALAGHSDMDYHALMASDDWQELAAACYAQGGRWALGDEIRRWAERVRGEPAADPDLARTLRRLRADHEDARKALGRAQARLDEIGSELARLRAKDPAAYAAAYREATP